MKHSCVFFYYSNTIKNRQFIYSLLECENVQEVLLPLKGQPVYHSNRNIVHIDVCSTHITKKNL